MIDIKLSQKSAKILPFKNMNMTTVLTPNRRLAATLHKILQNKQTSCELSAWQTPDILPITNWFERLHEDYINRFGLAYPLLLTTFQEEFIWEQIILGSTESTHLLQLSKMTEVVQSAWLLVKQWMIDIQHPLFESIDDCASFQRWAISFQKTCAANQWLDHASLPDIMIDKILGKKISIPKQIILLGFTELPPQWKKLLMVSESVGTVLHHKLSVRDVLDLMQSTLDDSGLQNNYIAEYAFHDSFRYRARFLDPENELTTMARWAKAIIKREQQVTIGCVIPSLEKIRDRVTQVFSEVFSENNIYGISAEQPFNISAGKCLSQYPVVHTALMLLKLQKKTMSTELFSYLLRSPFLGEAENEWLKRAHFDNLLRKKNINMVYLKSILNEQHQVSLLRSCPHLSKRINHFLAFIEEEKTINHYSHWMHVFSQLLAILGWPGERSLNSEEYQIIENWFKVISQLATFDYIAKPVDFNQAFHALERLLEQTLFQPKTPETFIQVLGTLEAAALPFDYLWIAGMDDLSWPPQSSPNPFIPRRIQRELAMPHATAEREFFYCQQLINQFQHSARHLIFSYAEIKDDMPLQVSPLIQQLVEIEPAKLELAVYQTFSETIYYSKALEKICDEVAPSLQTNDVIHGGVNVIKQQALCPFKAFAENRLYAQALESPLLGLKAKDRGIIIHKILEKIWEKLHDHQNLIQINEIALNDLITNCVADSMNVIADIYKDRQQYFKLEKQRLHRLIYSWLQIEKQRSPFTVSMQEKSVQVSFDKLIITIRIDRIDEVDDGKLIIDYKTGKNNRITNWFSDRPEDPQLPLYSLVDPDSTIGVSFAQLVPGNSGFKGISQYSLNIDGIQSIDKIKNCHSAVWHEQISYWKHILNKLSNDFYDGIAYVDPKSRSQTCMWCQLKSFCRIYEVF
ncbi:MAG: hypothetical protein A3F11_02440 [Gammaproteobacteria bacterium RIFCSPHIGHO2_12_FULL_37_14]|nr:MAG: hypothetical protein A3F11_02440 [Gammaproteobacteria bacterium RIFCSPHIGHO2_12_FULL_37_14]